MFCTSRAFGISNGVTGGLCFGKSSFSNLSTFKKNTGSRFGMRSFDLIRQFWLNRTRRSNILFHLMESGILKVPFRFKEHTVKVIKTCSEQCEFVLAHRIRRSQQIFSLYIKWWGNAKLTFLIAKLQQSILKRKKWIGYSLSSVPIFSWENQRIKDDELIRLQDELERVKKLMNGIDKNKNEPEYDENVNRPASDSKTHCTCTRCINDSEDEWVLLYSTDTINVWRREHSEYKGQGLYVYKVYGQFDDVTAEDFFQVQMDTDYRKEWDNKSVQLYIVDSEPQSNSDVLYWEFSFPKMFYNRDYVCNRRYKIDKDNKLMILMNESINHPSCPEKPPLHRVKEYWSHVVIKPKEDFNKAGIEFSITYFDNPGVNLPSYLTAWYTITGMPEYLMLQRSAAKSLAQRKGEAQKNITAGNKDSPLNPNKIKFPSKDDNSSSHQTENRFLLL